MTNFGSLLYLAVNRRDEARRLLDGAGSTEMTNAPYVYAMLGDPAAANGAIRDMEARTPRPWFVDVAKASVMLATGDTAAALTELEQSQRSAGAIWVYYLSLVDPAYDKVRNSPRFAALLRTANVDLRVVTNPRRGR